MKLNKTGNAIVLALVIASTSLTGCRWLKDHWKDLVTFIVEVGQVVVKIFSCQGSQCPHSGASGEVVVFKAPPNYRPQQTLWTNIASAVDNGRVAGGTGDCPFACDPNPPFFGDPDSWACDDCRSAVGLVASANFFNICVGGAYVLPAERVLGTVTAYTDRGAFESQPMIATRRPGTVRYSDCGSPTQADYDLDDRESHRFGQYVRDRGANELYEVVWTLIPTGAPDDLPLIKLADPQSILDGQGAGLDAAAGIVRVTGVAFTGGGRDPDLGPDQFDAVIMTSGAGATYDQLVDFAQGGTLVVTGNGRGGLKPCWSDADCSRWNLVCRSSDDGLTCQAP